MVSPMAGICVYISDSFLCCVGLAGPPFVVRIVEDRQCGQDFVFDLWTVCLFGLHYIQVLLGNPVAVKKVQNIKHWDCWLSCWGKLCIHDKKRMELIGQYPDSLGCHRSPGWGCAVVDCFVHFIRLRCFRELVSGIGVTALAGDVIHMTALSHLGGGFVGRSVWLPHVSQWRGFGTLQ